MSARIFISLLALAILASVDARKSVPAYLHTCSLSDPDLEKCMMASSSVILSGIAGGDSEYGIPMLTPFKVKSVDLSPSPDLSIKLSEVLVNGLDKTDFEEIKHDVANQVLSFTVNVPKLDIKSAYEIKGRILVLPIQGKGNLELAMDDYRSTLKLKYKKFEKDGLTYAEFQQDGSTIEETIKQMHFKLENLFNGDKVLGDEMNKFLNDNWLDVSHEFMPAVEEVIEALLLDVLNHFFTEVPYDELFLP